MTAARARAKGHETPAAWVWLPFCQAAVPVVTAALACAYFSFASPSHRYSWHHPHRRFVIITLLIQKEIDFTHPG